MLEQRFLASHLLMTFIFLALDNTGRKMLSQITGWFLGKLRLSALISHAGLNPFGEQHPKAESADNDRSNNISSK